MVSCCNDSVDSDSGDSLKAPDCAFKVCALIFSGGVGVSIHMAGRDTTSPVTCSWST